ncbi:MAG: hypothetical protein ACQERU_04435 [Bacteroidota bacterium]
MKKLSILMLSIFIISMCALAQETKDVVYLKNGSVIKGEITEMILNEHIKIKTADGSIFVYPFSEIEKTGKEEISNFTSTTNKTSGDDNEFMSEYFNQSSLGVAIGGGGIIGMTHRYFVNEQFGIEEGLFFRPGIYQDYRDDIQTTASVAIAAGPVYYLKANRTSKGKIAKNGVSVKFGISPLGDLNEFFGAVNWVHDIYKPENKNRYFSFELGAGFDNRYNMPYDISGDVATTIPMLYWKLNWFFKI